MSFGNDLRIERLRRLHTKFLDAADNYPDLFHVACRSDDERLRKIIDHSIQNITSPRNWKRHHDFWCEVVLNYGGTNCDRHYKIDALLIQSKTWSGTLADPQFEQRTVEAPPGEALFRQLSDEAAFQVILPDDFATALRTYHVVGAGARGWLELVYHFFPCEAACWDDKTGFPWMLPGETVLVTYLPKLFVMSARVVEMHIDRLSRESGLTTDTSSPPESPVAPPVRLSEAETRIVEAVREIGHRATTEEVLRRLEETHGAASQGTTKSCLAGLVRRGLLTNRQDVVPKGYGLPEWE